MNPELLIDNGLIRLDNFKKPQNTILLGFQILPLFKKTLETEILSVKSILIIISDVLNCLKKLHTQGYILSDLCLDNAVLDD